MPVNVRREIGFPTKGIQVFGSSNGVMSERIVEDKSSDKIALRRKRTLKLLLDYHSEIELVLVGHPSPVSFTSSTWPVVGVIEEGGKKYNEIEIDELLVDQRHEVQEKCEQLIRHLADTIGHQQRSFHELANDAEEVRRQLEPLVASLDGPTSHIAKEAAIKLGKIAATIERESKYHD